MAYQCEYCEKGTQAGHNIRHHRGVAGGRWKRKAQKTKKTWTPNLHYVKVIEGGKIVRRRLCTKCMRRANRPHLKKEAEKVGKELVGKEVKQTEVKSQVEKKEKQDGEEKKTVESEKKEKKPKKISKTKKSKKE